jgi:hypothetical protein
VVSISAWLHGLGPSQYEQAFRENNIDAELLPTQTDNDPRELGVASLGHVAGAALAHGCAIDNGTITDQHRV